MVLCLSEGRGESSVKDSTIDIASSGSDRISVVLKCKKVYEREEAIAGYGVYGAYSASDEPFEFKRLLAVEYKKGSGKIEGKLLADLLNPVSASISDKPEVIEGCQVDYVLTIVGGGGGELYFANCGFVEGFVKIRVIYGEPGAPPLARIIGKTIFGVEDSDRKMAPKENPKAQSKTLKK